MEFVDHGDVVVVGQVPVMGDHVLIQMWVGAGQASIQRWLVRCAAHDDGVEVLGRSGHTQQVPGMSRACLRILGEY